MKPPVILNINDVAEILEKHRYKIFGLGGFPSTRSEVAGFIKNYEIFFINKTGEYEAVREKIKIRQFKKKYPDKPYFVKKPEKILVDKKAQKLIKKDAKKNKIGIYVYLTTDKILEICKMHGWKMIGNPRHIYKKIDDRSEFCSILDEINFKRPKIFCCRLDSLEKNLDKIRRSFGSKFVIQLSDEGGGRGTFIIKNAKKERIIETVKKRLELIKRFGENHKVVISKLVDGPVMSITGCITRDNRILSSYAQYQLIDIKESIIGKEDAKGVFCGHDWSLSNNIPKDIHEKAATLAEKIGKVLKKRGALGIFGLDFIWDKKKKKIFPLEINPRLLGSFPTTVYVQFEKGEIPLVAFHILDFLGISYRIKNRAVYKKDLQREGSQLLLFNPRGYDIICTKGLRGGVYELRSRKAVFKRLGTSLSDIGNKNEFILTDGVPVKGNIFKKNGKIMRIMAKRVISINQGKELNSWAKNVVRGIYKKIKFAKYGK